MKCKKRIIVFTVFLVFVVLCTEIRPVSIVSSTLFSTENRIEIKIYVIANTLGKIDEKKLAEKVLNEYWKVNGKRENEVCSLVIYQTKLHYRINREYKTLYFNENELEIINEGL